jgi:hypothetical protein
MCISYIQKECKGSAAPFSCVVCSVGVSCVFCQNCAASKFVTFLYTTCSTFGTHSKHCIIALVPSVVHPEPLRLGTGLGVWGIVVRFREGNFVFSKVSRQAVLSTQPPTRLLQGTFSGVKWLRRENDQSCLSSAKIKNEWTCTSIPLYTFLANTGTTLPLLYTHTLAYKHRLLTYAYTHRHVHPHNP